MGGGKIKNIELSSFLGLHFHLLYLEYQVVSKFKHDNIFVLLRKWRFDHIISYTYPKIQVDI